MSSKNKKAAKEAANNAAGTTKPADAKVENKATAATEKGKAEATQQVAAPAATTQKKEDPPKAQTQQQKQPAQKGADKQAKNTPKKEKNTPTVLAEEVSPEDIAKKSATKIGIPMGDMSGGLSGAGTKAMLSYVGLQLYANNEEFKKQYPEAWSDAMQNVSVLWLLGCVDVRNEMITRGESGELLLTVNSDQIMPLNDIAGMLGIKLAAPKVLPGGKDGQMAIDFNAPETVVPEELNDKKVISEVPELDPKKVGKDHEKIVAALDYLIRKDRNIAVSLVNTIEWYRVLCNENAPNTDARLALEEKYVNEWMDEIFHLVQPAGLLKGLGRSVYVYTKMQGSPVAAHSLLHGQLKTFWNEEQIASALKVLIQENFRYNLKKSEEEAREDKSKETLKPTEDKAIQAVVGDLGTAYIDQLFADYDLVINGDDPEKNEKEFRQKEARKVIGLVRANYFPGKVEPSREHYRFAIGKILNLYRNPMDRLAEFEGDIPPLVGEYPAKKAEETEAPEKAEEGAGEKKS